MADQNEIDAFRDAYLRAGGPLGASDAAIRAGIEAVDQLHSRESEPCSAETWSWRHFNQDQTDGYWITCDRRGPHDEHEDEHTGLQWADQPATASATSLPAGEP